jgi:hypothetical protein
MGRNLSEIYVGIGLRIYSTIYSIDYLDDKETLFNKKEKFRF